jgi:hypothetical protein
VTARNEAPSIWWWAFGYFAAYWPYSALAKAITSGLVDPGATPLTGVELLAPSVLATVATAFTFLIATGWWRRAVPAGKRLPRPTLWTGLSGLCSAGIIATTTLAYTFDNVSIVFVMLLMRGGVLVMSPMIDLITRRGIKWYSWVALILSLVSLSTSMFGGATKITRDCEINVAIYLACYFVRLQIMTKKAKSSDPDANLRYFVEEQLVSSPALLIGLVIYAFAGSGEIAFQLHAGFTTFFDRPVWLLGLLVGVLSQGTGLFGGLILLDKRENTFSVPVNRASSVFAGAIATFSLWLILDGKQPKWQELAGAAVMIAAIIVLSLGAAYDRGRLRRAQNGI